MDLALAVAQRQLVTFTYDGLPRVVEPATYGTTRTGKPSLRGCLIAGQSKSNSIPCWELYAVAKMEDLRLGDGTFEDFSLPGYTTGDSAFGTIWAEH